MHQALRRWCAAAAAARERAARMRHAIRYQLQHLQHQAKLNESKVTMRLDLPFDSVPEGSLARKKFENAFKYDLSKSLGASVQRLNITNLHAGSVNVDFMVRSSAAHDDATAEDLAARLKEQAADPRSDLRAGVVTGAATGEVKHAVVEPARAAHKAMQSGHEGIDLMLAMRMRRRLVRAWHRLLLHVQVIRTQLEAEAAAQREAAELAARRKQTVLMLLTSTAKRGQNKGWLQWRAAHDAAAAEAARAAAATEAARAAAEAAKAQKALSLREVVGAALARCAAASLRRAWYKWRMVEVTARHAEAMAALQATHASVQNKLRGVHAEKEQGAKQRESSRLAEAAAAHEDVEARAKTATLNLLVNAAARRLHQAWRKWLAVVHETNTQALHDGHAHERRSVLEDRRTAVILALLTRASMRGKHMAWRVWMHLLVVPAREADARAAHHAKLYTLGKVDKDRGCVAAINAILAFHSKAVHRAWVKLVKVRMNGRGA